MVELITILAIFSTVAFITTAVQKHAEKRAIKDAYEAWLEYEQQAAKKASQEADE